MNNDPESGWKYKPDSAHDTDAAQTPDDPAARGQASTAAKTFSWEAPEYIEHHHGAGWYAALVLATVVLAAAVYFLTSRDVFAAVIVLVLGMVVGAFAGHKPAIVRYEINSDGLKINDKAYRYGSYKSFAIIREGAISSINLIPLKRFLPPISAYFESSDEKKVMEALGAHLPYEERQLDPIDRLSRRLRL